MTQFGLVEGGKLSFEIYNTRKVIADGFDLRNLRNWMATKLAQPRAAAVSLGK